MKIFKTFLSTFVITLCGLFIFIGGVKAEEVILNSSNIYGIASSYNYTGKAIKPVVTVKYGNYTLKLNTDYTVTYGPNINAGTGTVTIKGNEPYKLGVTKIFKINKINNTMSVTYKNKKIKYKKVKKKNQSISAITIKNAKGDVEYKKLSGNKKITINKRTGKITVKKKIKKGTYKVKIRINCKGTNNYKESIKDITIKIKVK